MRAQTRAVGKWGTLCWASAGKVRGALGAVAVGRGADGFAIPPDSLVYGKENPALVPAAGLSWWPVAYGVDSSPETVAPARRDSGGVALTCGRVRTHGMW